MILSNVEIVKAIQAGDISIEPLAGMNLTKAPFNTSSVDLRLDWELLIPEAAPVALRPGLGGISRYLNANSRHLIITPEQPFTLKPNTFLLGKTKEKVAFPIREGQMCYSARVEGKSSLARCGVLVHFTAPTIHAGFEGTITLEIINLGINDVLLELDMYICQLIIEEVKGTPIVTPSQFRGQSTPAGI